MIGVPDADGTRTESKWLHASVRSMITDCRLHI